MDNLILSNEKNNVLTITLNRFDKKNALNTVMYSELCRLFEYAEQNSAIHCLLIQGNEQCFCAGNDLADFLQHDGSEEFVAFKFVKQLAAFSKPIVVAIAGPAVGIGTTLLLHSDMVFSTNDAKFKLPFTQLGLCPEAASSLLLPLKMGHNKAFELLVLGNTFTGQQACDYGIVNHCCESKVLLSTALTAAENIAKLPADAVQTSRKLMKKSTQAQVEQAMINEAQDFTRLMNSDTCKSILSAFFK
ncbi:enoyl-CoA hydratase-related protein [Thalassotalea profundi]|uniref:Enoyl-CoA hydratase n=1 Tax=Thalassotalea profundi TaxID=2036687 RepID=A0ABQ3J455_9GAMM|nr:enoyl-CoA hydratase-related protein [Thalassotalea profundi]GHE99741.1 enoyl-CoA hydratase [Thalassotalea profundi]